MTKGQAVYTTKLALVPDPRSKYTAAERQAQFALSMKLYDLLGEMSSAVDRINGARTALEQRAASLPASDPLAERLRAASAQVDEMRRKIVATKEGGMITGEERLRENLSDLYGNVVGYEGRPTQTQIDRAGARGIHHEFTRRRPDIGMQRAAAQEQLTVRGGAQFRIRAEIDLTDIPGFERDLRAA